MDNLYSEMLNSIESSRKVLEETYLFLSTASEVDIKAFENKFNITIPEDYRFFLLNIANGIVNKNQWGFNLVEEVDFKDFYYEENECNPSIPFELTNKVIFNDSERKDSHPYKITYDVDDQIFDMGFSNGQIHIAGYGCGTSAFLVVNGSEHGNVWVNNYSSYGEVYPECDFQKNKPRVSFTDYLLKKIDREIVICNEIIEDKKRAKLIEEFDQKKRQKIAEENKEIERKKLEMINEEKLDEQDKEIEREQQTTFKNKKPRRDLLTYLIEKLFH